uniref:L1 transposable element RRM domain-containing protein n=1 Tax=Poecilia latipinna TaxID=48699 RepID=A0A3B3U250_9TELE
MTRGKYGRKSQKPELDDREVDANLETILQERRDFRKENSDALKGIKEEIKVANSRIDKAENRIEEAEERLQHIEEATMELQKRFETRLVDQEGRSRRENVRIHGLKEGAEAGSMTEFIEKLEQPPSFPFQIERAHRALPPRPSSESPPRSIVVKFMSFRVKEEIIKKAWQKKGFMYEGKKVFLDHDYAPEVLEKRKEYTEAKRVLWEKKIRSRRHSRRDCGIFILIYKVLPRNRKDKIYKLQIIIKTKHSPPNKQPTFP